MQPSIFKSYDIRGLYPSEIDDEAAYRVGRAFVVYTDATTVIVGRDMRLSSPNLSAALIRGLTEQGANVLDIGLSSTDLLYFACQKFNQPGIIITASHNPPAYGGIKMVKEIPNLIGGGSGMEKIKAMVLDNQFTPPLTCGIVTTVPGLINEYLDAVLQHFDLTQFKPLKIVVDASSGMASPLITELFRKLSGTLIPLCFEPDGRFPIHESNPLIPENRKLIEDAVVKEKADLGVIYDGDADRCFFIDEHGQCPAGDFMTALFGEYFCQNHPGAKIVYDVRASYAVRDLVTAAGGEALISRVGHTHIKKLMMETGAIFGGEISAHYYFKDFACSESALFPLLTLLNILSIRNQSLAELVAPLKTKYLLSDEINFKVEDPRLVIDRIKTQYSNYEQTFLDGITITAPTWHFNVRASNTEPLIRLNLEAFDQVTFAQEKEKIINLINN